MIFRRLVWIISYRQQILAAQERQQRQEWQAENSEMVTLDPFEQMYTEPLELIGADA